MRWKRSIQERRWKRRKRRRRKFIDSVISEVKQIWLECQLVRGSSRHSESNGGVEQVDQTVQKKLGTWMKENKTKQWSIGRKIAPKNWESCILKRVQKETWEVLNVR